MGTATVAKQSESIRIDAETAEAVRLAASLKKKSMTEYLRDIVLPIARRDIRTEARKLAKGDDSD